MFLRGEVIPLDVAFAVCLTFGRISTSGKLTSVGDVLLDAFENITCNTSAVVFSDPVIGVQSAAVEAAKKMDVPVPGTSLKMSLKPKGKRT